MKKDEVIYKGPTCPRCVNNKYIKVKLGSSYYKRCVDCGRTSSISESDNLQEILKD